MRILCVAAIAAVVGVVGVVTVEAGGSRQDASTLCIGSLEIGQGNHPILRTPEICVPAP
jgi:hypothetical protein